MLFVILWLAKINGRGTITNLLEELEEEFPSEARRKDLAQDTHKLLEAKSKDLKVLWSSMISLIGVFAKIVVA